MGNTKFDVIVIGGSYAGMSAALPLVRARRQVAVVDAGVRRNRFADASHGFLTQDGKAPGAIAAEGKAQLLAYPTVTWIEGTAAAVTGETDAFQVTLATGEQLEARRLILATGVTDQLPELPGLAERWGKSVFACPYCHGYELNLGRIGAIAVGPMSLHHAQMLPEWGTVTFFTNGVLTLDEAQTAELTARGVTIETTPVARVIDHASVELADGRVLAQDGLFVLSRMRPAGAIAEQLGCALEEHPMGVMIKTNEMKETSVPGVFACGDATRMMTNVPIAVGDGAMAGTATHRTLIF